MAAPSFVAASTGATDATGVWTATCHAPGASGRVIIFQLLVDGTTAGPPAVTGTTNINNLAGSAGLTSVGTFNVGSPTAATQQVYIGRSTSTSAPTVSGSNTGGDDLYWRFYEFTDVSSGTTLSDVIENATAGSTTNSAGTSTTASDASVQTLGLDRLALNFVAVNDDPTITQFSGQSGGVWFEVPEYADSGGTDGAIQLQWAYPGSSGNTTVPGSFASSIFGTGGTQEERAESFSSGAGGSVTGVVLYLNKSGTPTDNVIVEIQTDSGGVPSGTVVGTAGTYPCASLSTSQAWVPVPLSATLSASTTYWVVVRRDGARDITNRPLVQVNTTNTDAGGVSALRGSGTWTANSGLDSPYVVVYSTSGATIDGGTATLSVSAGWGVVGFALIGTTPSGPTGTLSASTAGGYS